MKDVKKMSIDFELNLYEKMRVKAFEMRVSVGKYVRYCVEKELKNKDL